MKQQKRVIVATLATLSRYPRAVHTSSSGMQSRSLITKLENCKGCVAIVCFHDFFHLIYIGKKTKTKKNNNNE